jgi:8-oxo-dGTP pyrophosphatase MutT (NUDIX family)
MEQDSNILRTCDIKLFSNRNNERYIINNKEIWYSRSVATGAVILLRCKDKDDNITYKVLLEQRSLIMDQPLKWCFPCGYLDWDETLEDSIIREIYEETNLYIPNFHNQLLYKTKEPFYIGSDLENYRQNIHIFYGFVYNEHPLFYSSLSKDNDEINDLRWVLMQDLNQYDFAFKHNERIKLFLQKYLYD